MGVLVRGDAVLLCHRHPNREWYPDVWDLPGGHIHDGEMPETALARELHEELGIRIESLDGPLLGVRFDDIDALVWSIHEWRGDVKNRAPDEHDQLSWFLIDDVLGLRTASPMIGKLCRLALAGA